VPAAPTTHPSRGFLPWRLSYTGPLARGTVSHSGRHPKTFTMRPDASQQKVAPSITSLASNWIELSTAMPAP
jgi:hypothetical protein